MIKRTRSLGLALSAAALVGLALSEGFSDRAIIPVPGDVATIGFGSTRRPDGTAVQMGDKTTAPRALAHLLTTASEYGDTVQRCAPVPMHQHEFDAYVSLAYNIGPAAFCGSTLVKKLNALDYQGACAEILKWDKFKGKPLPGLTNRRREEHRLCVGDP